MRNVNLIDSRKGFSFQQMTAKLVARRDCLGHDLDLLTHLNWLSHLQNHIYRNTALLCNYELLHLARKARNLVIETWGRSH